eukprot:417918-Rhodomonas_salina.1
MAWLWIQRDRRTDQRWDDVAIPCVALGFAFHIGKKGWLLGTINGSRRYYVSTNVSFDETKYPLKDHHPRQQALAQAWGASPVGLKPTVIDLNTFLDMPASAHDPEGPVQIVVDCE